MPGQHGGRAAGDDRAETPGPLLRGGCAWAGVPGLPAWQGRQAARSLPVSEPQRASFVRFAAAFPRAALRSREHPTEGAPAAGLRGPCGERRAGFAAKPHFAKGRSPYPEGAAERRRGMVRRRAERRPPGRRKARG